MFVPVVRGVGQSQPIVWFNLARHMSLVCILQKKHLRISLCVCISVYVVFYLVVKVHFSDIGSLNYSLYIISQSELVKGTWESNIL